jgi:hypothetical protein
MVAYLFEGTTRPGKSPPWLSDSIKSLLLIYVTKAQSEDEIEGKEGVVL